MESKDIIWRIDDRLIHGQIIVGWCSQLPIKKLIVCDDEIATTDWEKELLLMAAPSDLETDCLTVAQMAQQLPHCVPSKGILMVLVKGPQEIQHLLDAGVKLEQVNVGGVHYKDGRKEYLPYLFLSDEEVALFEKLMAQGVKFECRDLPNSPSHDLAKVLRRKK